MQMETLRPGFRYDRIADDDTARATVLGHLPETLPFELPRHLLFSENGAPMRGVYINEDWEIFWVVKDS